MLIIKTQFSYVCCAGPLALLLTTALSRTITATSLKCSKFVNLFYLFFELKVIVVKLLC